MYLRENEVNSLWHNDIIWRHRSGSTLAQVMACCLTVLSHYLHHCWLIISKVHLYPVKGNFTRNTPAINHNNLPKTTYLKFYSVLPRSNELTLCQSMFWLGACRYHRHSIWRRNFGEMPVVIYTWPTRNKPQYIKPIMAHATGCTVFKPSAFSFIHWELLIDKGMLTIKVMLTINVT